MNVQRTAGVLEERDWKEAMRFAADQADIADQAGDTRRRDFWLELMDDAHDAGVVYEPRLGPVSGGSDS